MARTGALEASSEGSIPYSRLNAFVVELAYTHCLRGSAHWD